MHQLAHGGRGPFEINKDGFFRVVHNEMLGAPQVRPDLLAALDGLQVERDGALTRVWFTSFKGPSN
jgi:hypothetical protein